MTDLTGKRAIITGAGGGLGRAAARRLAADGADLVLTDVALDMMSDLGEELGALVLEMDVRSSKSIRGAFAESLADGRGLDVLVNFAGVVDTTPLDQVTADDWDRVMEINVRGTFVCCQVALEYMNDGGAIVNIGSRAGLVGGTTSGVSYAASKAAVICLTKSLAKFAAPRSIRVNCVNPGLIDTPMLDEFSPSVRESMPKQSPFGRLGTAEEIAGGVAYLVGNDSTYMTGAQLNVNGGSIML
jgi:3-oxoacyl-[acyl-carrier protein] reductase